MPATSSLGLTGALIYFRDALNRRYTVVNESSLGNKNDSEDTSILRERKREIRRGQKVFRGTRAYFTHISFVGIVLIFSERYTHHRCGSGRRSLNRDRALYSREENKNVDCELFTVYNLGLTRRKGKKSALERDVYAASPSSSRCVLSLI